MIALASLVCGLILGFGLLTAGVTQPAKVQGFFDIFGRWDPTLAFAMTAALAVSGLGFALVRQRTRPVLAAQFLWPTRSDIDRPLIVGSILFGTGAGLVGVCPGAILVNLSTFMPGAVVLVLAMVAGMAIQDLWDRWKSSGVIAGDCALATSTDG
jgi:uncharacterized membrane protein YedE/YeeE